MHLVLSLIPRPLPAFQRCTRKQGGGGVLGDKIYITSWNDVGGGTLVELAVVGERRQSAILRLGSAI